jgi:hypothetical protein
VTLPLLPAVLNTGDYIDNDYVDRNRAYHDYYGETRPSCMVRSTMKNLDNSLRNLPNATTTFMTTDDTAEYTVDEIGYTTFWTTGNVDRIRIPVTGRWFVWLEFVVVGATSGGARAGFQQDGGSDTWITSTTNFSGANTYLNGSRQVSVTADTTFDFIIWQNSGAAEEVGASRWGVFFLGED